MVESHDQHIRRSFTAQAETMEDPDLGESFRFGLDWIVGLAAPDEADEVLDVAGGTGHVARALAPHVRSVTVLDATLAMVDIGRAVADAEGLRTVTFLDGDATELPFPDASFSLTVTRFSLHHMLDPTRVLAEMARVTRPGGRLVVVDLVASSDPFLAARQDEIERQRDPSHERLLLPGDVGRDLTAQGCEVTGTETRTMERPVEPWLQQAGTAPHWADVVRARMRAELLGGEKTGTRPSLREDQLWFVHTLEATTATRP